jgi:hypothetical protein
MSLWAEWLGNVLAFAGCIVWVMAWVYLGYRLGLRRGRVDREQVNDLTGSVA